jgi:hypothetical protein
MPISSITSRAAPAAAHTGRRKVGFGRAVGSAEAAAATSSMSTRSIVDST